MSVLTAEDALRQTKAHLDAKIDEVREDFSSQIAELKKGQHPKIALPGVQVDKPDDFSICRYAAAKATNNWSGATAEKAVFDRRIEAQRKALTFGTGATAGDIVPEKTAAEIIELLRADSVVVKAGARVVPNIQGSPYVLPRQVTAATGAWFAEGATITASDPTVDQVSLSPHTLAALTTMSLQLAAMGDANAEAFVRSDLAQVIQLGLDVGSLTGSGAAGQPTGISNTAGVLTQAVSATPTIAEIFGFPTQLDNNNALRGKLAWVMHPATWWTLAILRDESSSHGGTELIDRQLARRNLAEGPSPMLCGYPVYTTTQLNATVGGAASIIFGNWSDLVIGLWSDSVRIDASLDSKFTTAQLDIRAMVFADVGLRHPKSFCVAT